MSGIGAIGGIGGIGGVGGVGAYGGTGAVGGAGAASAATTGASAAVSASGSVGASNPANATTAVQPSAKVTISEAAREALAGDTVQRGATFSAVKASDGNTYVGGTDRNGFGNPDAAKFEALPHGENAFGQKYSILNRMNELVAAFLAAMLAIILGRRNNQA